MDHGRPRDPVVAGRPHYIPTPQFPRFPKNVDFRPKLRTGFSMVVFAIFAERPYPQKFSKFVFGYFLGFLDILWPLRPYKFIIQPQYLKVINRASNTTKSYKFINSIPGHINLNVLGYAV